MNAIIQKEAKERGSWDGPAEVHSIYGTMQQLKDSCRNQGKRYSAALILTYLFVAKAAGETTLQAATEWIRLRGEWLQEMLPQAGPTFRVLRPTAMCYELSIRSNSIP